MLQNQTQSPVDGWLQTFLGRRNQPWPWLFLAAAAPFAFLALMGAGYGAFWPYALAAGACVTQFWRATLAGWITVLLIYGAATVGTIFTFVEAWHKRGSGLYTWLSQPADTAVFFIGVALLLSTCVAIAMRVPKREAHAT